MKKSPYRRLFPPLSPVPGPQGLVGVRLENEWEWKGLLRENKAIAPKVRLLGSQRKLWDEALWNVVLEKEALSLRDGWCKPARPAGALPLGGVLPRSYFALVVAGVVAGGRRLRLPSGR